MSNKIKLIVAIVLVLLMVPVMGTVVVKDNMHNSSYCAACHTDYYQNWADPDVPYSLSHAHSEMGVSCQACHQRTVGEAVGEVVNYITGNYYSPIPKTTLSMDNCFACHGDYEQVIALTSEEVTNKYRNPHDGHWGELECNTCHNAHQDSYNYCEDCHEEYLEDDVPGWTSYNPE